MRAKHAYVEEPGPEIENRPQTRKRKMRAETTHSHDSVPQELRAVSTGALETQIW